jgi:hypothetical protein
LALADRPDFVALAWVEMDQTRCGERSLGGTRAHQKLPTQDEHKRVLMDLMLLQGLALGKKQGDHPIRILIGAKDLRIVRRHT